MKLENGGVGDLHSLYSLLGIPRKILLRTDLDNITEFVLHELCHNEYLNLNRAAYFVDNPDFNCFKGVAGIDRSEFVKGPYCIWDDAQKFSLDMQKSAFNKKIKHIVMKSPRFSKQEESDFLKTVAQDLSLKNPYFYTWDMRHGNHGIFLYEPMTKDKNDIQKIKNVVEHAACILSFCPLF